MRPARIGSVLAVLLFALSLVRALAQTDPGFEPVPAANISERTLNVPEENFSVVAPGIEWEWLRDKPAANAIARNYLCRNLRTGERFLLTVFKPAPESGEKLVRGILDGLQNAQEARGRQLVGARSDPSDIPTPGSYRLHAMIASATTPTYFTAYALPANRLYVLQHYSDGAKESAVFNSFARSFALVDPAAAAPARSHFSESAFALLVYGAILVVFVGLGSLVNALARKPVVSGGLVAFVLILIVATLKVAGELAGKRNTENIGFYLGEALLPALIAAWVHSRHPGKKRAKPG